MVRLFRVIERGVNNNEKGNNMNFSVTIKEDEFWWGGAVNEGIRMPLDKNSVYTLDCRVNETYNQMNPLWVSSQGRYLFVEGNFLFEVKEGEIRIDNADEVYLEEGFQTLSNAYLHAADRFFKRSKHKLPQESMLSPQYCTWVDMLRQVNERGVIEYAESIIQNEMPAGYLIIDEGWANGYGDWSFDTQKFPNPKGMVDRLHSLGFKVLLWVCPFVSESCKHLELLLREEALIKDEQGVALRTWWNGESYLLDGTNPFAYTWLERTLTSLMTEYGVDGFKFDAGDSMYYAFEDLTYAKTTPNEQSFLWAKFAEKFTYSELRACYKMGGASIVQRLADKKSVWGENGLSMLIPNVVQAGLLGYPYCCPDMIGGGNEVDFQGNSVKDEELFARSCECSALMPMMQFSYSIWRTKNETLKDIAKHFSLLRKSYEQTITDLIAESERTFAPILRNLEYVFPHQGLERIKDEFMLGDRLLVAPILTKGANRRSVVLPSGCRWKYVPNGKIYDGGQCIEVEAPIEILPYFERKE